MVCPQGRFPLGVRGAVVDKQVGWSGARTDGAAELLRFIAGSCTGREHYLDISLDLF
jgi:hypothetical protein